MNFWKNSKRPSTPPSFLENYIAIFFILLKQNNVHRTLFQVNKCVADIERIKSLSKSTLCKHNLHWMPEIISGPDVIDLYKPNTLSTNAHNTIDKTLPNAQRIQGLPAFTKRTAFSHVPNWSKFSFSISTKLKLYQTSGSKCWLIFSHGILTKLQSQNVDQSSASKSWLDLSLKVSTKNILQNLDQTSASISWPKIRFKISTKPQLQNLDQTVANTFLSNTIKIKKFWVGIFKGQSHINQVY